jgi:hypothetical protein
MSEPGAGSVLISMKLKLKTRRLYLLNGSKCRSVAPTPTRWSSTARPSPELGAWRHHFLIEKKGGWFSVAQKLDKLGMLAQWCGLQQRQCPPPIFWSVPERRR